jgi:hypothetical protein
MPRPGQKLVEINWIANPFRGDKFAEVWAPAAAAVLKYGATEFEFFRSNEDRHQFTQLAYFDNKLDFERYWYSEEISDARAAASGWFQVPVLPVWHEVVDAGVAEPQLLEP